MKRDASAIVLLLRALPALALWVGALVPPVRAEAPAAAAPAAADKHVLKLPHLQVDLKRGQILLEAEAVEADYALEFLLCRANTKEYESVLRTRAAAADLHAALLALGLAPGKPARWSGRGQSARFLPPQGPELDITLRWSDERGRHEMPAGKWLTNPQGKAKAPPKTWVFIGSDVLPDGRYWADLPEEGGIISVANMSSAVIDVPFESVEALEAREFVPDKRVIPKAGTGVEVVITPLAGAQKADHARALLEIDRLGQMRLDGQPIVLDKLMEWAEGFLADHKSGQVVLRAAAGALVDDLRRAKQALELAGVAEIEVIYLAPPAPILPRTAEQLQQAMDQWRERFARPRDFLLDPVSGAEALLEQIGACRQELQGRLALWASYAEQVRRELEKHRPATRPAAEQTSQGDPSHRRAPRDE